MNKLGIEKRVQVISALVEGNSIRSTCRMTGTAKGTVIRLLRDVGKVCIEYQDRHLRNLTCKKIECDEIWNFVYAKERNVPEDKKGQFGYGDVWTFTAIDADTKLIATWLVGQRDVKYARVFIDDLKDRLANRVQLTTDGHRMYMEAIDRTFGPDIDYARLVKYYGTDPEGEKHYSPPRCIHTDKHIVKGNPDVKAISTSFVERQNLTMRMSMRRFTRLTNAFSKKVEYLEYHLGLHFMYYNFARHHKTLANPYPRTPAMAAGIENHIWTVEDIVRLSECQSS